MFYKHKPCVAKHVFRMQFLSIFAKAQFFLRKNLDINFKNNFGDQINELAIYKQSKY